MEAPIFKWKSFLISAEKSRICFYAALFISVFPPSVSAMAASQESGGLSSCANTLMPAGSIELFSEELGRAELSHSVPTKIRRYRNDLLSLEALAEREVPNTAKKFHSGKFSVQGFALDLETEIELPLYRYLVRLKKIWEKAGAEKPFPSIILVSDRDLPDLLGAYFVEQSTILIRFSEFDRYFKSGGIIPQTLIHELRHASFSAFEQLHATSPHAIHLPTFISDAGNLATKDSGYSKFISSEESSIYYKQFLGQLIRSRKFLNQNLLEGVVEPEGISSVLLASHVAKADSHGNVSLIITAGIQKEALNTLVALQQGKAMISYSKKSRRADVVRMNDGVRANFPCPNCWGSNEAAVKKNVLDYFQATFLNSLPMQEARVPALRKTSALMNELNRRRIAAEKKNSKPLTKTEIIQSYDEAIRILNAASLRN